MVYGDRGYRGCEGVFVNNLTNSITPGEKLGLSFTPPVIAISNSISICINKHTS